MAQAKSTTDHDTIRNWVEARGGCPARVKRTARGKGEGVLRIDYTGFSGQDTLEKIAWDDWFRTFDESNLAFLYQDGTSRFSKLVDRSSVNKRSARGRTRATSARKSVAKRTTTGRASAKRTARGATKTKASSASPRKRTRTTKATAATRTRPRAQGSRTQTTRAQGSRTRRTRAKTRAKKSATRARA